MNKTLLDSTVEQIAQVLLHHQLRLCTVESCTGGMVSAALTELAGSSKWFERGYITYSNEAKQLDLGVPMDLIQTQGAVSISVAKEMALGALRVSGASVSLSVTGVAGPSGGSLEKPVGFVCFGWAWLKDGQSYSHTEGVRLLDHQAIISNQTRTDVRLKARDYALAGLLKQLQKAFNPDSA